MKIRRWFLPLFVFAFAFAAFAQTRTVNPAQSAKLAAEWRGARQISPAELEKRLSGPKSARPLVLQVGFKVLYDGAHIPGGIFAGPASTSEGLVHLKEAVSKIQHDKEVVIYCGCCPWEKCPNVKPAYEALRQMGFTRVVVLLIPRDFAHDWVEQGYPVGRKKSR